MNAIYQLGNMPYKADLKLKLYLALKKASAVALSLYRQVKESTVVAAFQGC